MPELPEDIAGPLAAALAAALPDRTAGHVEGLARLSGGANMETWALDWCAGGRRRELILRRLPGGGGAAGADDPLEMGTIDLPTEAALLQLAAAHGVPVPQVALLLEQRHGLGTGYLMSRERGEALPNRILGDERYAAARENLAWQCGQALGRIHGIPREELPAGLRDLDMEANLDRLQGLLDLHGNASTVHQLALNWLREHQPPPGRRCLVHGDFRNGNLLVDEQGLVAVLDWELAHVGFPAEDLGYLCGNVWRFGRSDRPVGGFGDYEQLLEGYRSVTGAAPTPGELHYWEVYCALGWGLVCLAMVGMYRNGRDRSVERAAIGRRMSESEVDLLLLLEKEGTA